MNPTDCFSNCRFGGSSILASIIPYPTRALISNLLVNFSPPFITLLAQLSYFTTMPPSSRPLYRLLAKYMGSLHPRGSHFSPPRSLATSVVASRQMPSICFARTTLIPQQHRYQSKLTSLASKTPNSVPPPASPRPDQPAYELTFTCKPCKHRSAHRVTKHGYHRGTVLIQCPSCKNRHIVSDHLKIFTDEGGTLEEILTRLRGSGVQVKKGKLGIRQGSVVGNEGEEDIEFWEDGTETTHKSREE